MIFEQKQILRSEIRLQLRAMEAVDRESDSVKIASRLAVFLNEIQSGTALGFAPMASEPVWWAHPGVDPVRFAFPRIDDNRVVFYKIKNLADLTPGSWGALEPPAIESQRVDVESADLMLVPGLAFDLNGRRLGRGKGFYDAILSATQPSCWNVGVAFDCQMVSAVPTEDHDREVDGVLTPSRFIQVSRPR